MPAEPAPQPAPFIPPMQPMPIDSRGSIGGAERPIPLQRFAKAAEVFRAFVNDQSNIKKTPAATPSAFGRMIANTPSHHVIPPPSPSIVGHIPEPHLVEVLPTASEAQHNAEWWATKTPDEAVRLLFDPRSRVGYADVRNWNDAQVSTCSPSILFTSCCQVYLSFFRPTNRLLIS
jgi:hypothetical protein